MTLAYWTLIGMIFVTYVYTAIAKFARPGYNNSCPREYLSQLEGWPKRAYWAHLNSLEVLPQICAALIIAHTSGMPQSSIDFWSVIFLISRILYGIFYMLNRPWSRSYCWLVGMFIIAYLITGNYFHG